MDRLPQEVYTCIVDYLQSAIDNDTGTEIYDQHLAGLATVSRAWQRAVERRTFQTLKLKSTELDDFKRIIIGTRRQNLKELRYSIQLPPYDSSRIYDFERNEDRAINNIAFSTAIHGVFGILASWEKDHLDHGDFEFWLFKASSPTDPKGYRISRKRRTDLYDLEKFTLRFHYSYLELIQPERLPVLHNVRYLDVENIGRKFAPQVSVELWSKMPNLQIITCPLLTSKPWFPLFSRHYQGRLASAISSLSFPENIREISLVAQKGSFLNHAWKPDDTLPLHVSHDPLGAAIRERTGQLKRLTHLEVSGRLDSSLFWPAPKLPHGPNEPFWQNLRYLEITFDEISPSGQWYFRARDSYIPTADEAEAHFGSDRSDTAMPPGYPSTAGGDNQNTVSTFPYEHQRNSGKGPPLLFRLIPDEALLVPLMTSFARACQQISHLEHARLETQISDWVVFKNQRLAARLPWGVFYAAQGNESGWQDNFEDAVDILEEDVFSGPRLTFCAREWSPDPRLLQQLRKIGNHGDDLTEVHLDLWGTVKKQGESFLRRVISTGGPTRGSP